MSVQQIIGGRSVGKATNDTGHEITNNDEITDTNTETLDSYSSVENDGSVGVCDLAQSKEARITAIQIPRASCLKVEAEARSKAGPDDDEDAQQDAHVGQSGWHGQHAGADNGVDEVDDTADPARLAVDAILLAARTARHAGGAVGAGRRVAWRRTDGCVTGHCVLADWNWGCWPATRTSAATVADHDQRKFARPDKLNVSNRYPSAKPRRTAFGVAAC